MHGPTCIFWADLKPFLLKVEAGGAALEQPGYFIPPTILSNVTDGMR